MAMLFFIGQVIMCPFIPYLQDRFGRKRIFLISTVINFYTLLGIWGLPDHSTKKHGDTSKMLLDLLFLINGLATPGRVNTGYTYFQEFFPEESQNMAGTLWNMIEGSVYIGLTMYWKKLNFGWRWTLLLACVLNFIGILLTSILLPDSPKWLYEKKKYKECVAAIRSMAELNNVRNFMPP